MGKVCTFFEIANGRSKISTSTAMGDYRVLHRHVASNTLHDCTSFAEYAQV